MKKSEKANQKHGKIYYHEKQVNRKVILSILVLMAFVFFILIHMTAMNIDEIYHPLILSIPSTLAVAVSHLIILKLLTFPLIIYEEGFEEPISLLTLSEPSDRFVPFSKVENIHLRYINDFRGLKKAGLSVRLKDGKKIEIKAIDEKLENITDSFRSSLGKKWEDIYDDRPYSDEKELEEIKKTVSKSKTRYWAETGLIIFTLIVIFSLLLWYLDNINLIIIIALPFFIPLHYEMVQIMNYYHCKKIMDMIKEEEKKRKPDYDKGFDRNVIRKIEDYEKKDWGKLETIVNSKKPILAFLSGFLFLILILEILKGNIPDLLLYALLAGDLMGLIFTPFFYFWFVYMNKVEVVKKLVEIELKEDKKILPDDFNMPKFSNIPLRNKPSFSEEEWEKLIRSTRFNEISVVFITSFLAFIFPLVFIIVIMLLHNRFAVIILSISAVIWMLIGISYIFINVSRLGKLKSVLEYERYTGNQVIPDKYRDRIEEGNLLW